MVDATQPWQGGYAALSSFGFGGSNVHLLLHGRPGPKGQVISVTAEVASLQPPSPAGSVQHPVDCFSGIVPLAARTAEGLEQLAAACQVRKVAFFLSAVYVSTWCKKSC